MFETVKNKVQKSTLISLLQFIVAATQSEAGHAFAPQADAEKLQKAEPTFIVIDAAVKNNDGFIKVIATQTAIDALKPEAQAQASNETQTATEPMNYQIVDLTEMPEIKRGGHKSDNYPFDKLTVFPAPGNAFFVPVTEKRPNPAKSLASTVASATKRYASKDKRVFTVRKATDASGKLSGAYVIRTA